MATTEIVSGAGLRRIHTFALDAAGYPSGDQSGADGYDGIRVEGAQGVAITTPDSQPIVHVGDDVAFAQDFLPPNTIVTANITTGKSNFTLDAIVTDTLVHVVGEGNLIGRQTNVAGNEIDLATIYYRQALDTDEDSASYGLRRWKVGMFPKNRMVPKGSSADQGAADQNSYNVFPTPSLKYPWGLAFSEANNRFTQSAWIEGSYEYPPMLERWTGNNTLSTFNLTWTPVTVAKTIVYVNGAAVTVDSVDTGNKTVTLNAAPGNAAVVTAWYETTDNI